MHGFKHSPFGDTGLMLSPMGLGTVKFGRNQGVKYPKGFDLPDDKHILDLLSLAQDLGINVLDTAPSYGNSEERLGKLLAGQRQDWIIVGKVGEEFDNGQSDYIFTPDHFEMSVERSLKRLNTDYLDVLLIHSDGNDDEILDNDDLIRTMQRFKDSGAVRAIGASTKTVSGGIKSLDRLGTVMACYNPNYTDEKPVLDYAAQHGKGVFLKKVLASGHVDTIASDNPVQYAMDFVYQQPADMCAILGTLSPQHLQDNATACLNALERFQ